MVAVAIVDDVVATVIIAVAYTTDLQLGWATTAVVLLGLVLAMRRFGVWLVGAYVMVGFFVWFATLESGIHPTVAGVVLGLIAPAVPLLPPSRANEMASAKFRDARRLDAGTAIEAAFLVRESVPITQRLQHVLHPWTSYVIIPLSRWPTRAST